MFLARVGDDRHATHFLRSYRGTRPRFSSGTLMSLQEGIAVLRARTVAVSPFVPNLLVGALTSHTEPPPHPATNLRLPASCLRYLTPVFPSPPPRTLFPNRAPVGRSTPCIRTHYSTFPERGMELVGERPVCSVATSGCPTRSEDGFPAGARNIPPRPAQPNSK